MHAYERLDQKPFESTYLYFDTTINFPVERVWPHALRISTWMTDHRLETVAGEPGRVGHLERVFPRDIAADAPLAHHHLYGIAELVPHKLIALEVFPEKGGSYGDTREWMGFDTLLFTDLGARTRLAMYLIAVSLGHGGESAEELEKRHEAERTVANERIGRYFANLRRLVELEGST